MTIIFLPTKKEKRFEDLRGMKNRRQEYEKDHGCKSSKEMWDTFPIAYEGMSQFQTINNNLRLVCKTYDNYDQITKVLRMSKAFKVEESCGNTLDEDYFDEDELSFISRKI
ncbi:hypothetical protein CR513_12901, partial [Mucuna pruriens]